jgi:diacylglycerol kinase (ATP)
VGVPVWLIVNPRAGGGRGAAVLARLRPLLEGHGIAPIVHVCASGDEPTAVARDARAAGAQLVVAIGGDGHSSAVADALVGGETALAVVPAGSANDYARVLGVRSLGLQAMARLIAEARASAVDVVHVSSAAGSRHVLTVAGTGFDALVAERAMAISRLRGAPRYVAAMLAELPHMRAARFTLELDGERREVAAMLIAVANASTYGGGMRVAPAARLQSGRLEVCIVGEMSRLAFLRAFPRVFAGTHVSHPAVTMLRARQLRISGDERRTVIGDGEPVGRLPAELRVLPGALRVVAGPSAQLS